MKKMVILQIVLAVLILVIVVIFLLENHSSILPHTKVALENTTVLNASSVA
jgi:uncharacterized membrane protein YvbJ